MACAGCKELGWLCPHELQPMEQCGSGVCAWWECCHGQAKWHLCVLLDAARAPRRRAAATAVDNVPCCAPAGGAAVHGRSAAIVRAGVWGWRVACVSAYGGASAIAAWGLSLLVAVWCCVLPCMCAHAHYGHAVPAKGCMHVAVCSWLCTPNTSPGMHFTHTTLRHA